MSSSLTPPYRAFTAHSRAPRRGYIIYRSNDWLLHQRIPPPTPVVMVPRVVSAFMAASALECSGCGRGLGFGCLQRPLDRQQPQAVHRLNLPSALPAGTQRMQAVLRTAEWGPTCLDQTCAACVRLPSMPPMTVPVTACPVITGAWDRYRGLLLLVADLAGFLLAMAYAMFFSCAGSEGPLQALAAPRSFCSWGCGRGRRSRHSARSCASRYGRYGP
jgi:hypothetical protein